MRSKPKPPQNANLLWGEPAVNVGIKADGRIRGPKARLHADVQAKRLEARAARLELKKARMELRALRKAAKKGKKGKAESRS